MVAWMHSRTCQVWLLVAAAALSACRTSVGQPDASTASKAGSGAQPVAPPSDAGHTAQPVAPPSDAGHGMQLDAEQELPSTRVARLTTQTARALTTPRQPKTAEWKPA